MRYCTSIGCEFSLPRETPGRGMVWSHCRQAPYCAHDAHQAAIPRNSLGKRGTSNRVELEDWACRRHACAAVSPFCPSPPPALSNSSSQTRQSASLGKPVRRPRDCTDPAQPLVSVVAFSTPFLFPLLAPFVCEGPPWLPGHGISYVLCLERSSWGSRPAFSIFETRRPEHGPDPRCPLEDRTSVEVPTCVEIYPRYTSHPGLFLHGTYRQKPPTNPSSLSNSRAGPHSLHLSTRVKSMEQVPTLPLAWNFPSPHCIPLAFPIAIHQI